MSDTYSSHEPISLEVFLGARCQICTALRHPWTVFKEKKNILLAQLRQFTTHTHIGNLLEIPLTVVKRCLRSFYTPLAFIYECWGAQGHDKNSLKLAFVSFAIFILFFV